MKLCHVLHCRKLGILLIMGIILIVVRDSYKSTKMYCRNVNNLILAQYYWVEQIVDPILYLFIEKIKSMNFDISPQVLDMKFTIDALERERDWYFWKLQTIVVWLQTKCAYTGQQIVRTLFQSVMQEMDGEMDKQAQDIVDILYATEDGYPDSFQDSAPIFSLGNINKKLKINESL